jgi:hypothetical protein
MTDDAKKQAEEIAQLKSKVAELEAKVSPPKSDFKEMSDAEWFDKMHAISERRMALATPPEVVRYFADGVGLRCLGLVVRAMRERCRHNQRG